MGRLQETNLRDTFMNLLDYLTKEVIETARTTAASDLIRIFAPDDPGNLARMADATLDFRLNFLASSRRWPDSRDLQELKANAKFVRGGPKVIRPSPQACRLMAQVELNLTLDEYAQPYESTGVVIPKSVSGLEKDVLAISHWKPGLGIFVGTHIGQNVLYNIIGPHWQGTLEEHLGIADRYDVDMGIEEPRSLSRLFSRIAFNACLFAVERGVRLGQLDERERRCRSRADRDDRSAMLAARVAQEAIIQDLDLILQGGRGNHPSEPSGRHLRLHRRRGHWKMQAYGPGSAGRKRIFVASYLVNAEGPDVPEITSIIS